MWVDGARLRLVRCEQPDRIAPQLSSELFHAVTGGCPDAGEQMEVLANGLPAKGHPVLEICRDEQDVRFGPDDPVDDPGEIGSVRVVRKLPGQREAQGSD